MRTFVMGEIHGNYRALQQCLDRSGFNYKTDKLIQLGDITDGYNEVYQCVELLLQIKNLVAIKGNHVSWFDQFIQTGIHPDRWIQGGYSTAYSYLKLTGREDHLLKTDNGYATSLSPSDIPKHHQQFFRNQQLYHIDEQNNLFVHAGFDRYLPFNAQRPDTFYGIGISGCRPFLTRHSTVTTNTTPSFTCLHRSMKFLSATPAPGTGKPINR